MEIFKLFGSIFVDNEKANESISKTDKKAESVGKKFAEGAKTVGKWGLALGGACAAGATALMGVATKSAETADRIDKLSNKIGISKQGFQEWDYVMAQNGMDAEKLQVGLKTLTSQMDAAQGGSKKATEAFGKLGLAWEDGNGKLKSQEEMMNEAIYALANMENGTEKARLATELFGKAGIEMMPMLNNGAQGIDDLKNRAHELGLVMSDEAVTSGVVLGDTLDDVKKSFGAIVTKIGTEVMPIIQSLLEWVLANMPQIQAVFGAVFSVISTVVGYAGEAIQTLIGWFSELSTQAQTDGSQMNEVWNSVKEVFTEVFGAIWELIQAFGECCQAFWDQWGNYILTYIGEVLKVLGTIFKGALDLIVDTFKIFSALFKGDWSGLWDALKSLILNFDENMAKIFNAIVNGIINIFLSFSKSLGIDWGKLWEGLKTSCSNIWKSICEWFNTAIMAPINTIVGVGAKMYNAGKEMFNQLWNGIKDVWKNISSWVSDKVSWISDKVMFWNKSEKQMSTSSSTNKPKKVDGSHANGLSYVPYNGYVAELHEGERVLTRDENKSYGHGGVTVNIINPSVRNDNDLKEFERMSYNAFDTTNRALGVV